MPNSRSASPDLNDPFLHSPQSSKSMKAYLTYLVFGTLFLVSAAPPVPPMISYQGRVQVQGTNFTGQGQFKFALVSAGTSLNRQATATATVTSGFVTSLTVTDGGNGYLTPPTVTITDNTGSGATATAQVSGGAVTSITVNNAGNNYTSPTVTLGPPTAGPAYDTYWSHDDSSSGGGEPSGAIDLPVQQGLVMVMLGDGSTRPIPVEVF